MPLATLKRQHTRDRATAARVDALEARLACVARLMAHYPNWVPTPMLRAALGKQSECAPCVSAYTACWVHA